MAMKTSATILTLAEWPNTAGGILRKLFPLLFLLSFPSYEKKNFRQTGKRVWMDAIEKQMTKASSLFGTERKSATNPVDSRYICLLSKKTTSPPLLEHFVFQGTGTGHPIHRNGSSQPPAVSAVYRCEFLPNEWTKQEKSFFFQNNSSLKKKNC